jgi:Na+/H+ antiporter NhaD/arsenite permease-like protein
VLTDEIKRAGTIAFPALFFYIRTMKLAKSLIIAALAVVILLAAAPAFCSDPGGNVAERQLGETLPLWSVVPFCGILLSIALFPLLAPHFWHNHFGKVSFFWAVLLALPFIFQYRGLAVYEILHIFWIDYVPFIILLWALFTVAGGIVVSSVPRGTPVVNAALIGIGTLLASWIGTTGAAMVMIRPLLRANADRARKSHIVCFFIILVANVGGALTPLGDPPLFLGFLHNVPFFWVTTAVLPHMLFASIVFLLIFLGFDIYYFKKEKHLEVEVEAAGSSFKIEGAYNFIFLAGIVGAVVMSGYWKAGQIDIFGLHLQIQNMIRDILLIAIGLVSLKLTPGSLREKNEFSWMPIQEVAKLFAGIFITIIPALAILKAGSAGPLAGLIAVMQNPSHYFWVSGALSSVLDNAPTYLTFFNQILGRLHMTEAMVPAASVADPVFISYLKAVSVGAVFMGANTYIGNAPNFMVKSIAEEAGVNMPSFFGYILKYTLPVLIPVFVLVTLVFF